MSGTVTLRDPNGQVYCVLRISGWQPQLDNREIAHWVADVLDANSFDGVCPAPDPKSFEERHAVHASAAGAREQGDPAQSPPGPEADQAVRTEK